MLFLSGGLLNFIEVQLAYKILIVPGLFSFIAALLYLEESPRYLLINNQIEEAVRILSKSIENSTFNED